MGMWIPKALQKSSFKAVALGPKLRLRVVEP